MVFSKLRTWLLLVFCFFVALVWWVFFFFGSVFTSTTWYTCQYAAVCLCEGQHGVSLKTGPVTGLKLTDWAKQVDEHALKISPSLPCNARSQEHTAMAGFLCGYLGFELGPLPTEYLPSPRLCFLSPLFYNIFKDVSKPGEGAHASPCSLEMSQEYVMYLNIHLACLVRSLGLLYRLCVAEDWVKMGLWRKLGLVFIKHFKPHKASERPLCHSDLQWPQGPLPGKQGSFCPCSLGSP